MQQFGSDSRSSLGASTAFSPRVSSIQFTRSTYFDENGHLVRSVRLHPVDNSNSNSSSSSSSKPFPLTDANATANDDDNPPPAFDAFDASISANNARAVKDAQMDDEVAVAMTPLQRLRADLLAIDTAPASISTASDKQSAHDENRRTDVRMAEVLAARTAVAQARRVADVHLVASMEENAKVTREMFNEQAALDRAVDRVRAAEQQYDSAVALGDKAPYRALETTAAEKNEATNVLKTHISLLARARMRMDRVREHEATELTCHTELVNTVTERDLEFDLLTEQRAFGSECAQCPREYIRALDVMHAAVSKLGLPVNDSPDQREIRALLITAQRELSLVGLGAALRVHTVSLERNMLMYMSARNTQQNEREMACCMCGKIAPMDQLTHHLSRPPTVDAPRGHTIRFCSEVCATDYSNAQQ